MFDQSSTLHLTFNVPDHNVLGGSMETVFTVIKLMSPTSQEIITTTINKKYSGTHGKHCFNLETKTVYLNFPDSSKTVSK